MVTNPPVAVVPSPESSPATGETAKSVLDAEGPEAMASWVRRKKGVMVTDTTMRDAHQVIASLLVLGYAESFFIVFVICFCQGVSEIDRIVMCGVFI